jgi:predicted Zn-ribbon and HTH transcriptional regulator
MECGIIFVYQNVIGIPSQCPKCGTPRNVELTQEQRMMMERMQQQGPRGGQAFYIRR